MEICKPVTGSQLNGSEVVQLLYITLKILYILYNFSKNNENKVGVTNKL